MRSTVVDGKRPCSVCKVYLPNTPDYFHRYAVTCKPCASERSKAHRAANHARCLARQAEYRRKHPTPSAYWAEYRRNHRADLVRRSRAYYIANREKFRADGHRRYLADPERVIAQLRRWQEANPAKVAAHVRAKNLRRRGVPLNAAAVEYVQILLFDPCSYCGQRSERIEIDHITPVAAGGSSEWTNLTAACRQCNNRKHARTVLEFMHA